MLAFKLTSKSIKVFFVIQIQFNKSTDILWIQETLMDSRNSCEFEIISLK